MKFSRRELPLRKAERNVLTYDDLLTRLRDALARPAGEALADRLREQFSAALIDELYGRVGVKA